MSKISELSNELGHRVIICAGTGCVANGSLEVYKAFQDEMIKAGIHLIDTPDHRVPLNDDQRGLHLTKSGCQGFCQMGPLVTILPQNILYCMIRAVDVPEIVSETIVKGKILEKYLYLDKNSGKLCQGIDDNPFYTLQKRTVLANCGLIDPESLPEYLVEKGYEAARKAFCDMSPAEVCQELLESGLRGRGGGGFPAGRKWEMARTQPGPKKYVICNGDEGDPGAFMDRSLMEGNPHCVIEGLMIAARAIGADEGYFYVRTEYPLAVERLRKAVADATAEGILGDSVFGTEHSLTLHVMEGAGAFVCGEETALIASIEGKRGMPTPKPPFPAQSGLWEKPTIINNVETLATVPMIIRDGAKAFRADGTEQAPGTKTFALTGHVLNTGLIEVPMGTTLRHVVENVGGGVTHDNGEPGANFKAVQIGGPSGGCLTKDMLDTPLDYESLRQVGAMIGSGGLVVMNDRTCMVRIARFFMQFTQNESCGKCVLCREGTKQMLALLDDIIEGEATAETLTLLEDLADAVSVGSLCALGKTAPSPVLSTLKYFREEYEAHVFQKSCPAKQCKKLLKPSIDAKKCVGCGACARKCPVAAITGERKKPHVINEELCIKCGVCAEVCKFNAVI